MGAYYENKRQNYPVVRRELITQVDSSGNTTIYQDSGFVHNELVGYMTRMGHSLTQWRDKISKGENATTSFQGLQQWVQVEAEPYYLAKRHVGNGTYHYHELYTRNGGQPWLIPRHPFSENDIATVGSQALAKFLKRYRARTSYFQGAVFAGELRETLRMLRSPLKGIRETLESYFIAVYKSNGRTRKRDRIKRSSDLWLEYSFGLSPLLSDLGDAYKAYFKLGTADQREAVSAFAEKESVVTGEINGGPSCAIPMLDTYLDSYVLKVRYLAGLKAEAQNSLGQDKYHNLGLTAQHIGAALWELTPWSFLVDYFTNIGDIIEAGLTNTSNFTWGCRTVRIEGFRHYVRRANRKAWLDWAGPGGEIDGVDGSIRLFSKTVERTSLGSLVPSFSLEIPGYGTKWLNMAALAASRSRAILSF